MEQIQESSVGFSKKDLEKIAAAAAKATNTPPTSFFKPGEVIPDHQAWLRLQKLGSVGTSHTTINSN